MKFMRTSLRGKYFTRLAPPTGWDTAVATSWVHFLMDRRNLWRWSNQVLWFCKRACTGRINQVNNRTSLPLPPLPPPFLAFSLSSSPSPLLENCVQATCLDLVINSKNMYRIMYRASTPPTAHFAGWGNKA